MASLGSTVSNCQANPSCNTLFSYTSHKINSDVFLFTDKQYVVIAGQHIEEGQQRHEKFSGRCVHKWTQQPSGIRMDQQPLPVALIELTNNQDVSVPTGDEHDSLQNMEGWKDETNFILKQYTIITNKDHGLYRVGAVISAAPVIHCGSLVMSSPRFGETVYGTFIGCLQQESDDGAEPVEWYIVFPFTEIVLDHLKDTDLFRGKTFKVLSVSDHGLAPPSTFKIDAAPSRMGSS